MSDIQLKRQESMTHNEEKKEKKIIQIENNNKYGRY